MNLLTSQCQKCVFKLSLETLSLLYFWLVYMFFLSKEILSLADH